MQYIEPAVVELSIMSNLLEITMARVIATAMTKVATTMINTTTTRMINTTSMINRCHTEVASHVFLCLLEDGERLYKEEQKSVYIESFLRQDKILNIIRRHLSLSSKVLHASTL
jgi:hypothetical protein